MLTQWSLVGACFSIWHVAISTPLSTPSTLTQPLFTPQNSSVNSNSSHLLLPPNLFYYTHFGLTARSVYFTDRALDVESTYDFLVSALSELSIAGPTAGLHPDDPIPNQSYAFASRHYDPRGRTLVFRAQKLPAEAEMQLMVGAVGALLLGTIELYEAIGKENVGPSWLRCCTLKDTR